MADVSVVKCDSYEPNTCRTALEEAISAVGGLDFIKPGDTVIIKANLVSAMKPEKAATTHPSLLVALTDMLTERGASVIIGDSPGGLYSASHLNRIYSVTGLKSVEAHGAKLNDDFRQSTASYPDAKIAKSFLYTSYLDSADWIIDFCKLKSHGMMGMSAGAKNMFGAVPGTVKPEYHYKYHNPSDFADMIIDLNCYFKPVLTLCDAVDGMEGNGPTAGTPRHIGAIFASRSSHLLDLLCAAVIGYKKDDVLTLSAAFKRGLIPEKAEMLDVYGDWRSFVIPEFHKVTSNRSFQFDSDSKKLFGRIKAKFIRFALKSKPNLKKSECVGCAECFRVCPAKAITMEDAKPRIDRDKCICCFCCQEFCPKGAMKVKRTFIARTVAAIGSRKAN